MADSQYVVPYHFNNDTTKKTCVYSPYLDSRDNLNEASLKEPAFPNLTEPTLKVHLENVIWRHLGEGDEKRVTVTGIGKI